MQLLNLTRAIRVCIRYAADENLQRYQRIVCAASVRFLLTNFRICECRQWAYFVEKLCVASVKELDIRKSDKGCRLIADLDLLSLCIWPDLDHPAALGLSCGGPQQVH